VKHESLGQTARYWVGQGKQGRYIWKRNGKRFSLTRGRGHDGRIREVLQESSCSSMYKVYDNVIYMRKKEKLRCCELPALYSLVPDYCIYDHLIFAND
jgi:hypothetical protein